MFFDCSMKINQLKKCVSLQLDQMTFIGPSHAIVSLVNSYGVLTMKCAILFLTAQVITADPSDSNSTITDDQYNNIETTTATLGIGAILIFSIFGFFGLSLFCYSRLFPNSEISPYEGYEESKSAMN